MILKHEFSFFSCLRWIFEEAGAARSVDRPDQQSASQGMYPNVWWGGWFAALPCYHMIFPSWAMTVPCKPSTVVQPGVHSNQSVVNSCATVCCRLFAVHFAQILLNPISSWAEIYSRGTMMCKKQVSRCHVCAIWVCPKMVYPQNRWFSYWLLLDGYSSRYHS